MMAKSTRWKHVKLGKIAEFRNGVNYNKESFGSGVKVVGVKDFQDYSKPKYDTLEQINPEGVVTSKSILHDGDIIFVRSNGNRELIGRSLFIDRPTEEVTHSAFTIRVRFQSPEIYPKFYSYFFRTSAIRKGLTAYGGGTNISNLNQDILSGLDIPIPDLSTQRKIAGFLSAYDDLIENNLRRIKILEEMAQSLYREWFVHFRFPGHESAKFVGTPLGQIPKGWNATMLGEFVDSKSVHLQTGPFGTQLKASHYSHEGTPVINVRNIGFGTLRAEKLEFLPPDKVDELKRHQLRSGDIVFGRKGAVERHLLVGPVEDGWIQGSDCIRLRVVSGPLTPRFLSIGFREAEHQRWMMNQCSGGATMASLNQDILCRIPLAVPPPELIAKFDRFSTSAVDQVDVLASKIQTLRRTRDLLLPRLLSEGAPYAKK